MSGKPCDLCGEPYLSEIHNTMWNTVVWNGAMHHTHDYVAPKEASR